MQEQTIVDETNKENTPTTATKVNPKDIISLEVLAVIKECQSQHGLKHGDYQRYRQYCAKRLQRIRKALNFAQTAGTKNRTTFSAKPVTSELLFQVKRSPKDTLKMLTIPLISAERCWAYAMQLKQEANSETRKKFHMIRRFRKAVFWSERLRDLCNSELSKCDARTKLETCAYADYLNGIYHFEIENWTRASELLTKAQNIYEKLFGVINDEEHLAFYKQRVDEIKPTLRYCAFNVGEGKGGSGAGREEFINKMKGEVEGIGDQTISSKIEHLIDQTRVKQAEGLSEIEWLGKQIFVKDDKIRSFLLELKDPANNWQDIQLYEGKIFECRDCLQILRDSNSDKSALYHYLTYLRLDLISKRNLRLVSTLTNPADILRQYEIVIGGYNEIKQLPLGQFFPDDYLVERFGAQIDAQITGYKAHRCYYIGMVAKQNWKESIALLDRAGFYAKEALANEFITDKATKEELQKLLSKADADKFAIYAESISKDDPDSGDSEKPFDPKLPLIQQLDTFNFDPEILSGNVALTTTTPEYRAVPCKPLFFDLALNHIRFPNLDDEINKPKAGLTGMVKGWLGGWRK